MRRLRLWRRKTMSCLKKNNDFYTTSTYMHRHKRNQIDRYTYHRFNTRTHKCAHSHTWSVVWTWMGKWQAKGMEKREENIHIVCALWARKCAFGRAQWYAQLRRRWNKHENGKERESRGDENSFHTFVPYDQSVGCAQFSSVIWHRTLRRMYTRMQWFGTHNMKKKIRKNVKKHDRLL